MRVVKYCKDLKEHPRHNWQEDNQKYMCLGRDKNGNKKRN